MAEPAPPMTVPRVTVYADDCLRVLANLPDNGIDAVVTDPPYGLSAISPSKVADALTRWGAGDRTYVPDGTGFVGHAWDRFVPPPAVWDECYRVLKPGGHLLAFAGSRTHDLMGLSIRLAHFEIRDSLAWLYGSGFPKSADVAKLMDKSTGHTEDAKRWEGWGTTLKPAFEPITMARKPLEGTVAANVRAYGTGALNVRANRLGDEVRVNTPRRPATSPERSVYGRSAFVRGTPAREVEGRFPANVLLDEHAASQLGKEARYFYTAKAPTSERPMVGGVAHPTVKPLAIMRWLLRLVVQPGGLVLDPFAGSGTTLEAALLEGFAAVGIEANSDFLPLIETRMARALDNG